MILKQNVKAFVSDESFGELLHHRADMISLIYSPPLLRNLIFQANPS